MWFSVVLLLVTALARLRIWDTKARNRPFTIALTLLALGFAAQIPSVADPIDRAAGRHMTDLVHIAVVLAALTLLGLIPLSRERLRHLRYPWIAYNITLGLASVVLSNFGEQSLPDGGAHQDTFAVGVLSACVLIVVTVAPSLSRQKALAMMLGAAVVGLGSAALTVWASTAASEQWVADHYNAQLTVTSILASVALSGTGFYGVARTLRNSRS
ncbi:MULTISPECIES: hypothetical protein [Nocardia]|uniref:hypothetical protein n=1 Tax=Nocardia TaxID=1817 RepID=UPI000D693E91|nr:MULTISPECIES: hypothetical protein [Nocardia]